MARLEPAHSSHPHKETLSAYVDGELDAAARAQVERHLRTCGVCTAIVADYRRPSDFYRRLPTERVPTPLRWELYRRIDEYEQRRRWLPLGLPLPSANALGLVVTALLLTLMAPQLMGVWAVLSNTGGRNPPTAAQGSPPHLSNPAGPVVPALPTEVGGAATPEPPPPPPPSPAPTLDVQPTSPATATVTAPQATSSPAPTQPSQPVPTSSRGAGPAAAAPPPTGVPPSTGGGQGKPATAAPTATAGHAGVAGARPSATRPAQTPVPSPSSPAAGTPTVSQAAVTLRTVSGVAADFHRGQKAFTVSNVPGEPPTRKWQVTVNDGTMIAHKDGRKLRFEDVGIGDRVEVSGFETPPNAGVLMASSLRVLESAVRQPTPPGQRPRVLFVLDGAAGVRAPQYGFTGDWSKRLSDTGYEVTVVEPAQITAATSLADFQLIVIGYPATLPDSALQRVKGSKLPILNAEPRLVQSLGLGLNVDPAHPVRMVPGRTVEVDGRANQITRGFSGETSVANANLQRTPIVSNGAILAWINDGGQRRAVWSITGTTMYFGFWWSGSGQNHNDTYWTLFDRSVLMLIGR